MTCFYLMDSFSPICFVINYGLLFFLWHKNIPLYICATLKNIHLSVNPPSLYDKSPGESTDAGDIS